MRVVCSAVRVRSAISVSDITGITDNYQLEGMSQLVATAKNMSIPYINYSLICTKSVKMICFCY